MNEITRKMRWRNFAEKEHQITLSPIILRYTRRYLGKLSAVTKYRIFLNHQDATRKKYPNKPNITGEETIFF